MSTQVMALNALSPGRDLEGYISTSARYSRAQRRNEERALAEDAISTMKIWKPRASWCLAHLRFVVHLARSYQGYGLPLGRPGPGRQRRPDEGGEALRPVEKGVRLVSFAVHWIKAEMHEYIIRNWRIVKVATTKAQRKLFFNLRGQKKRLGWLSAEEAEAVADDLGVPVATVSQMESRLAAFDLSFDGPAQADDEDTPAAPVHYLEDNSANPEDLVVENDWQTAAAADLAQAFAALDERSQDIVQSRWLSETKLTLQELADRYGVSAERIRQLEKNAMKKLKKSLVLEA